MILFYQRNDAPYNEVLKINSTVNSEIVSLEEKVAELRNLLRKKEQKEQQRAKKNNNSKSNPE